MEESSSADWLPLVISDCTDDSGKQGTILKISRDSAEESGMSHSGSSFEALIWSKTWNHIF
jgi:hypothetical protein